MPLPVITNQLGTLVANAGLTQNIDLSSTTASPLSSPSYGSSAGTASNGATSALVTSFQSNWPQYLVILALAYFGYQQLK